MHVYIICIVELELSDGDDLGPCKKGECDDIVVVDNEKKLGDEGECDGTASTTIDRGQKDEEGAIQSDSSNNNYKQEKSSSEDDDILYDKFVENKGKGKIVEDIGDSSSSDMEDVVYENYDDFDEAKLSDVEKSGPNFSVFNPHTIFNPQFEGGHIFSTKVEFKKAAQSIVINQRRSIHFPKSDKDRCYAQC
ncbi:hypothetical protein ACS0TY_005432 [Phlomoides rotata]